MQTRSIRSLGLAAFLVVVLVSRLAAQGSDRRIPDGRALGVTVGRYVLLRADEYGDKRFPTGTLNVSSLKRNDLGPEFGLTLFPTLLVAQDIAIGFDVGAAFNVSLPYVTILPRVGASGLFEFGPEGSANVLGFHFGASALINFSAGNAIRLDLLRRENFTAVNHVKSSYSIGIGISSVTRVKRR